MKTIVGIVAPTKNGYHVAALNLRPVMHLIEERMRFPGLQEGTLNVNIPINYIVIPGAVITPQEYDQEEILKLQRCLLNGYKALIMRPDTHEIRKNFGHGKAHFEIMGRIHFRTTLNLEDGDEVETQIEGDEAWWNAGN